MCPFIAYCVIEFEILFCGLIFWYFLLLPLLCQIKIPAKYKRHTVFEVFVETVSLTIMVFEVFVETVSLTIRIFEVFVETVSLTIRILEVFWNS